MAPTVSQFYSPAFSTRNVSIQMRITRARLVRLSTFAIVVSALPFALGAQRVPTITPKDCDNALETMSKDHFDRTKAQSVDAFLTLDRCPNQSVQLRQVSFRELRSSTDTIALSIMLNESADWRDGRIFDAASALARDAGASPAARLFAIAAMERQISPSMYRSPERFLDGPAPDGEILPNGGITCSVTAPDHTAQRQGPTPLPSDAREQLRALLDRIEADSSSPAMVRRAARCVH